MIKILLLTKDKIDENLESILSQSDGLKYETIKPENLSEKNLDEYSLILIDLPIESIKKTISSLHYSKLILIALEQEQDQELESIDNRDIEIIYKPYKKQEAILRLNNLHKMFNLKNEIAKKSSCDNLTGLYNRNYLMYRLEEELSRSIRHKKPLSCMIIDVDYFKVINDVYGYKGGDSVLKQLAQILRKHLRKEDVITRYGDAQFVIILPDTTDTNTFNIAERIRKDVSGFQFFDESEPMTVTISIGISVYPSPHMDTEVNTLVRYAEHALFNSKKQGKNKVLNFSDIQFEF